MQRRRKQATSGSLTASRRCIRMGQVHPCCDQDLMNSGCQVTMVSKVFILLLIIFSNIVLKFFYLNVWEVLNVMSCSSHSIMEVHLQNRYLPATSVGSKVWNIMFILTIIWNWIVVPLLESYDYHLSISCLFLVLFVLRHVLISWDHPWKVYILRGKLYNSPKYVTVLTTWEINQVYLDGDFHLTNIRSIYENLLCKPPALCCCLCSERLLNFNIINIHGS
jgi:hypothetical protein